MFGGIFSSTTNYDREKNDLLKKIVDTTSKIKLIQRDIQVLIAKPKITSLELSKITGAYTGVLKEFTVISTKITKLKAQFEKNVISIKPINPNILNNRNVRNYINISGNRYITLARKPPISKMKSIITKLKGHIAAAKANNAAAKEKLKVNAANRKAREAASLTAEKTAQQATRNANTNARARAALTNQNRSLTNARAQLNNLERQVNSGGGRGGGLNNVNHY
jgi:hypothetical protein